MTLGDHLLTHFAVNVIDAVVKVTEPEHHAACINTTAAVNTVTHTLSALYHKLKCTNVIGHIPLTPGKKDDCLYTFTGNLVS